MQFLKTLFWVVIAVVAVIFSYRNWYTVTIALWGGLAADIKLPVLLLLVFLVGCLPMFLLYWTTRWQLRRKLDTVQRALEEARVQAAIVPGDLVEPAGPQSSILL